MTIFNETVTTETEVENLPTGQEVIVQTTADVGIAFWNPVAGAFGSATTIVEPGAILICPDAKAKITTTTTADVNIVIVSQ